MLSKFVYRLKALEHVIVINHLMLLGAKTKRIFKYNFMEHDLAEHAHPNPVKRNLISSLDSFSW